MSDFLVDFRPADQRQIQRAATFLKFYPDMHVEIIEDPAFSLVLTRADDLELWGSFRALDDSVWVGLCGRVTLDESEWRKSAEITGTGGRACKALYHRYATGGIKSLEELSGNFVILVWDRQAQTFSMITDRWGLFPAFEFEAAPKPLFCSHPDLLADTVGESRNLDLTSLAEFILAGKLSFPFTYYQRIKALDCASTFTIRTEGTQTIRKHRYFDFAFDPQPLEKMPELAEALASGFRKAVSRRTLPLLGRSAIALSGGLDSRTVLCASRDRSNLVTFSCYDEQNREFRIAKEIARREGAKFLPLQRSPDYYADSARLGVTISAGMGCFASNHFLGFRDELKRLEVDNLLTGCYCDYLFKGLALNKKTNRWTTVERLGPVDQAYYAPHFPNDTPLGLAVRDRLRQIYPLPAKCEASESTILDLERRRIFPLSYEADNTERTIPQRTMGWFPPIAENDLMEVYLKMSPAMKLNRRLFSATVAKVCGPRISAIPDANTGVRVNAPPLTEALGTHLQRFRRFSRRIRNSVVSDGSWPNWPVYLRRSRRIHDLWHSPNPEAFDLFRQILGKDNFQTDIGAYSGNAANLFLQLLTLKLWLDGRTR